MLAVPVRVEQRLDALAAELIGHELQHVGRTFLRAAIHHHHAVGAVQRDHVASGARDEDERIGQACDGNRRVSGRGGLGT